MVSLSHLHKLKSHSTNERPTQQKPKLKQTNKKNPLCLHVYTSKLFVHIFRAFTELDSGQLFPVCLSHF